jgi:hypothetical protein
MKYLRNRKDGYIFAYNENAAENSDFEVVEFNGSPDHPAAFASLEADSAVVPKGGKRVEKTLKEAE